uniref:Nudix hydrolase domain-containing protein n=1 Tax=Clastoptera arizonana TaxID=38151 RepID=A0A1B6DPX1_9HEMI
MKRQNYFNFKSILSSKVFNNSCEKRLTKYSLTTMLHSKCRNNIYPSSDKILRFNVPDEKVLWNELWKEYMPVDYTAVFVKNKPWADPDINDRSFKPKWNVLDGSVNRKSFISDYEIRENFPINPMGRTGLTGRGILGKWGPNHAADPIVTKWKLSNKQTIINKSSKKPILQFVAIKRRDCGEWAIPGGMVDPGELVSATLKREFMEEALNSLESNESEFSEIKNKIEQFFTSGQEIYKGYVDDPRNTDNAWMETVAMQFHDEKGDCVSELLLNAGDDAVGVTWMDISKDLPLYASHSTFIKEVATQMNAHW